MKRHITVLFMCMIASVPALASKARMTALGQDVNGSPVLEDTRMVFLNPALLGYINDFANFEWGDPARPAAAGPRAEGGIFQTVGGFEIGLQLGREMASEDQIALINNVQALNLLQPNNTFEVMIAGDAGLKWGASIIYGSSEDNAEVVPPATTAFPNQDSKALEVRGGVATDMFHAYGHVFGLMTESNTETAAGTTNTFEADPSFTLGGAYNVGEDQKVYAEGSMVAYSGRNPADAGAREVEGTDISIGYVRFINPNADTRLFYSAAVNRTDFEYKAVAGSGAQDFKSETLSLPLLVGVETKATEWFTLRGSVSQAVLLDQSKNTGAPAGLNGGENDHVPNTTTVAAGAGFNWKGMYLDATFAGSGTGVINANSLFTNASLTYLF